MNSSKNEVDPEADSKGGEAAGRYDPDTMSRLRRFIKLRRSAVIIQSIYRRNVAARKVGLIRHRNHLDFIYRTASRMQALVRAFQQRKKFAVALKDYKSKNLLQKQTAAVILLQARTRAFQKRMRYLATMARQKLNPTLRRHARSYLSKGDLWTMLKRVNTDFAFHDAEHLHEREHVATFIKDIIEQRTNEMRHLKTSFKQIIEKDSRRKKLAAKKRQSAPTVAEAAEAAGDEAADLIESMVDEASDRMSKLATDIAKVRSARLPKPAKLRGETLKDANPFELKSMEDPVHKLIMLSVLLTWPPSGFRGLEAIMKWIALPVSAKKLRQRERIRVRAAPYVDTLRREGIHTLKDLVGVSVMALGYPIPLARSVKSCLKQVQQQFLGEGESDAASSRFRGPESKRVSPQEARGKTSRRSLKGVSPTSSVLTLITPKNEKKIVQHKSRRGRRRRKPSRRQQLALEWMKELEDSYGITTLDTSLDRFVCFTVLRVATKEELEEPEIEDEEMIPEIGDTYHHHLVQMLRLRHEGKLKQCAQAMKRRADRAAVIASPSIVRLKKAGYKTIRSLLMCPLKSLVPLSLAEGISDALTQLRTRHPEIFTSFPPCDTRYRRSATDINTVQANPLPPLLIAKSSLAPITEPDPELIASIKKINAQRPHHYEDYAGRQSTQRALVQCKVKRIWADSFKRKSGRDYHYVKAIPKLTHKLLDTIKRGSPLPKELERTARTQPQRFNMTLTNGSDMTSADMIDTLMTTKHPGGQSGLQEVDSLLSSTWPEEMKSLLNTLTAKSDS